MLDVEQWAELRREHFVRGVPIKELVRQTGLARNTIKRALRSDQPPRFKCPERPSKLDLFKDEIHRLLKDDPKLSGVRVRELIEPLGFDGSKTIVDDYLREVRPVFLKSVRRVEALVCLMQVALTAYQLLERFYRQSVPADGDPSELHVTTGSLLRVFRGYGLIERSTRLGRVVHATRLTPEQARVLRQLGFPTPAQLLAQVLAPLPLG